MSLSAWFKRWVAELKGSFSQFKGLEEFSGFKEATAAQQFLDRMATHRLGATDTYSMDGATASLSILPNSSYIIQIANFTSLAPQTNTRVNYLKHLCALADEMDVTLRVIPDAIPLTSGILPFGVKSMDDWYTIGFSFRYIGDHLQRRSKYVVKAANSGE